MRDFTADRRLMQQKPGTAPASGPSDLPQQRLQAAQNRYNAAKAKGDQAGMTAATQEVIKVATENGLIDVAMNGAGTLARTALEIQADRAKKRVEQANQASINDQTLQVQRGNTVIGAKDIETKTIFQSQMQEPTMVRGIFGTIKMCEIGVCAIAKLFGKELDTSGFDTYMDQLKAKFIKDPSIDTSGIQDVGTTVTSDAGADRMDKQADDAIGALSQDQTELNNMIGRISAGLDAKNGGQASGTPAVAKSASAPRAPAVDPNTSFSVGTVMHNIKALQDRNSVTTDIDLTETVNRSAGADKRLSVAETKDLHNRLEAKVGAHDADVITNFIYKAAANHVERQAGANPEPVSVSTAAPSAPVKTAALTHDMVRP